MWNGVGHLNADAQFHHFPTSSGDRRGKVEIKLNRCKSYPIEGIGHPKLSATAKNTGLESSVQ